MIFIYLNLIFFFEILITYINIIILCIFYIVQHTKVIYTILPNNDKKKNYYCLLNVRHEYKVT